MLEVKNLTKTFKKKDQKTKEIQEVGINNVSFTAKPGRIFGLLGANGAGKTTTMRIIADLTSPHSGEILLDGKRYKDIKDIKMQIGFVSGETQIFDRLTPYEILKTFGQLAEFSKEMIEERITSLSEMLQMKDFLHTKSSGFSTGMKQKVSIARALITDPKVLIFDEITNGLDIFAARAAKDLVKKLRDEDRIIIYTSHIMPDADELCDDIAIIHKGKIILDGEKKNLFKENKVERAEDLFFKVVTKE